MSSSLSLCVSNDLWLCAKVYEEGTLPRGQRTYRSVVLLKVTDFIATAKSMTSDELLVQMMPGQVTVHVYLKFTTLDITAEGVTAVHRPGVFTCLDDITFRVEKGCSEINRKYPFGWNVLGDSRPVVFSDSRRDNDPVGGSNLS